MPGTLALFLVVPWLVRDHPLGRAVWGVVAGTVLIVALVVCQLLEVDAAFTAARERRRRPRAGHARPRSSGATAAARSPSATGWAGWRSAPPSSPCRSCPWRCRGVCVTLPVWLTPVLHLASQAVYPAAVLVAVLRGRMWGLQLAVSRTVLAGLMTVTLTTTYVVVTWLVTRVVPGSGLGQLVGAAAVAVAVQPARLWLERRVHRLVHGTAATPDHVVRRLGSHLSLEGSADALLRRPRRGRRHRDAAGVGQPRHARVHDDVVWGDAVRRARRRPAAAPRRGGRDDARSPCPGASRSARPGSAPSATWPTSSPPPWR